jgi:hypothetical protein
VNSSLVSDPAPAVSRLLNNVVAPVLLLLLLPVPLVSLLLSLLLDWLFSIIAIICDRSFSAAAMMLCWSVVDVSDEDELELELVFFDVPDDSSRSESSIDVTLAVDLYLYWLLERTEEMLVKGASWYKRWRGLGFVHFTQGRFPLRRKQVRCSGYISYQLSLPVLITEIARREIPPGLQRRSRSCWQDPVRRSYADERWTGKENSCSKRTAIMARMGASRKIFVPAPDTLNSLFNLARSFCI